MLAANPRAQVALDWGIGVRICTWLITEVDVGGMISGLEVLDYSPGITVCEWTKGTGVRILPKSNPVFNPPSISKQVEWLWVKVMVSEWEELSMVFETTQIWNDVS